MRTAQRYIDDIFSILPTIDICKIFIGEINNQCSYIQLDSVTIGKSGIFLDLELKISNENLISKVYQKPSKKYLYSKSNFMIDDVCEDIKKPT